MSKQRKLQDLVIGGLTLLFMAYSSAQAQTMDDIHKEALKEGGALSFYATLAEINAQKLIPVFEKRFPASS